MEEKNPKGPDSANGKTASRSRLDTAKPTDHPDDKPTAKPTDHPDDKPKIAPKPEDLDQDGPGASDAAANLLDRGNKEAWARLAAAIAFGITGPVVVCYVLSSSVTAIEQLVANAPKDAPERIIIAAMIAHAIVSIAAVYFGYTMLKAAERLFVPQRLLRDKQDVEVIRAILGIDTPSNAIASQAKTGANEIVELVGKLSRAVRGGNDKDDSK